MSKFSASVNSELADGSFWVEIRDAEHVDRCSWKYTQVWSYQLTSDLRDVYFFGSAVQWSCLRAVSVPMLVLGGLRGSTATSALVCGLNSKSWSCKTWQFIYDQSGRMNSIFCKCFIWKERDVQSLRNSHHPDLVLLCSQMGIVLEGDSFGGGSGGGGARAAENHFPPAAPVRPRHGHGAAAAAAMADPPSHFRHHAAAEPDDKAIKKEKKKKKAGSTTM